MISMAVTRRFTDQIVVMQTPEMGQEIKDLSQEFGVSVAQVARDAQALGLPQLRAAYVARGMEPIVARTRRARRAGNGVGGTKSITVPAAIFDPGLKATTVEQ